MPMSRFDFSEGNNLRGSDADDLPDHLRDGSTVSVPPRQAVLLWSAIIATWLAGDRLVDQVERFARWPHSRIAVTIATPVLALAVACGVTVTAESPSVADAGMAVVVTLILA